MNDIFSENYLLCPLFSLVPFTSNMCIIRSSSSFYVLRSRYVAFTQRNLFSFCEFCSTTMTMNLKTIISSSCVRNPYAFSCIISENNVSILQLIFPIFSQRKEFEYVLSANIEWGMIDPIRFDFFAYVIDMNTQIFFSRNIYRSVFQILDMISQKPDCNLWKCFATLMSRSAKVWEIFSHFHHVSNDHSYLC